MAAHCNNGEDKLLERLPEIAQWAERLDSAPDAPTRLEILRHPPNPWRFGNKDN